MTDTRRRTGRTYRMLQRALALALDGQAVYVVAASDRHCTMMRSELARISQGKEPGAPIYLLAAHEIHRREWQLVDGMLARVGDTPLPTFVDHYVSEQGLLPYVW